MTNQKPQLELTQQQRAKVVITTIIIFIVLIWMLIPSCDDKQPAPEKKHHIVYSSEWDGSVYQVKDYLKNNLKDWDSYESMEWSQLTEYGDTTAPSGYVVRNKYRAKNSFGGYVIENKIFYLDSLGNIKNIVNYK